MGSRLVSVTKKTKKALLSISDGRASSFFNTFIKIITSPPFFMSSGFSGAKIRRKIWKYREIRRKTEKNGEFKRKSEKIREKLRKIEIICKFMCISVRIICKSSLISVRFVSFFCSKAQTPQGSFTFLPFYLFTFKCPCRKNRNYYLCTMRLPESER